MKMHKIEGYPESKSGREIAAQMAFEAQKRKALAKRAADTPVVAKDAAQKDAKNKKASAPAPTRR